MTDWLAEVKALRATAIRDQASDQAGAFPGRSNVRRLNVAEPNQPRDSEALVGNLYQKVWRGPDLTGAQSADLPSVEFPARDMVDEEASTERTDATLAEVVARLHATFERIHPFLDGNGRAGRLLTNLMLVRLGYPPIIIQKRERSQYLKALDRADNGEVGPLGELFARAILDNLNRFILPAIAGPARLVPLEALATEDFKISAMRKAIERGSLRATRAADGTWRSSRQWVDEYRSKRWVREGGRPSSPAT
jgi:hypothetical protein